MDYSELLRSAWRITWRYKYLWVLGLFASEGGGCGFSGGSPGNGGFGNYSTPAPGGAEDWLSANWPLLLALGVGLLVFGLAMWVVSIITTGGLISGTDAAYGRRPDASLGAAWRAGVHSFWRLLGLGLLVGLAVFLVILLLVLIIGLPIGLTLARGADFGVGAVILIVILALVILLVALPAGVVLQIVLTWANRSLVLEGTGVVDSWRAGWRLFRANVGTSLLVWLIGVGVSIGVGVALLVPLAIVGVPIGIAVYRLVTDGGTAMWGVLAILGLIAAVMLAFYKAVVTTYFGAFWTVAYRNLTSATGPSGYVSVQQLMQTSQAPWTQAAPGPAVPPPAPSPPAFGQAPPGPVWTSAPSAPPAAPAPPAPLTPPDPPAAPGSEPPREG